MKVYPVQAHYTNSNYTYRQTFGGKNFAKVIDSINYNKEYTPAKWFEFFQTCMENVEKEKGFQKVGNLFNVFKKVQNREELVKLLAPDRGRVLVNKKTCIAKDSFGDLVYVNLSHSDNVCNQSIEFVSGGKNASFGIHHEYRTGINFFDACSGINSAIFR